MSKSLTTIQSPGFKKKLIAAAVGSAMLGVSGISFAQDDNVEEVLVTGIKGSLQRAMDLKRDSQGVVDAISAEDMGKFPDTNLAESLQRITGVSIDRQNGEGQRITIRGLGPDFNLVLLNGRQMPAAGLQETVINTSRSFDFSNLASEAVSGVDVYKTSNATISTGGMGATVNIKTTRPLANPGVKAIVSAKAVYDESGTNGADITPEVSGLFSNTFADDRIGVSLTASHQKRDGGFTTAGVPNGWFHLNGDNDNSWGGITNDVSNIGADDVYGRPQNFEYSFVNFDRERTNSQLTLQFRPIETLTATVDYTYTEQSIATDRNNMSVWFDPGQVLSDGTKNKWTAERVAGPLLYTTSAGSDLVFAAGAFAQKNENDSAGLNLEWDATENLTLALDYHKSSAESAADSPYGNSSNITMATFDRRETSIDFSQKFPVLSIDLGDDGRGVLDAADLLVTGSTLRNSAFTNDIEQLQLSGTYNFDDSIIKSVDFGASSTESDMRATIMTAERATWGGEGTAADIPDGLFEFRPVTGDLSNVSTRGAGGLLLNGYFDFSFAEAADVVARRFGPAQPVANVWPCGAEFCVTENWTIDQRVSEEYASAYVQTNLGFDIGAMPANLTVGVRYEETDVASSALVPELLGVNWISDNEFAQVFSQNRIFTDFRGSYDNLLPNVDFNVEVMEDVVLRASYSETIARATYNNLAGGVQLTEIRSLTSTASRGNPGLLPHESENIDLSAEWYFGDASYVSLGYFQKTVDNFVGNSIIRENLFGLRNPSQGARQRAAVAALGNNAATADIRDYIFDNYPESTAATGTNSNGNTTGAIQPAADDDLLLFNVSIPVNEKTAKIDGIEFAVQHTLESGFGGQFNYTMVDSDAEFDVTSRGPQFAMPGLSDTANVVAFYDNNGIQVRLAYNWRDKFLANPSGANGAVVFTEEYAQWDITASYEVNDALTVFVEGINITDEYTRQHSRHENELIAAVEQAPRYNVGVRYEF